MKPGSISRFVFAICVALATVRTGDFVFLTVLIAAVLSALLWWGCKPLEILKIGRFAIWIVAFIFILHLFSHSGDPIFTIWFLTATTAGARSGLLYGLKLVTFVYSAFIILLTVDPFGLVLPLERAARRLGRIGRFVSSFALSFSLSLRFLPELSNQGKMTLLAFRSKGVDLKGGMIHKARVITMLVSSVFVNAFKKSESVAMALSVKGYSTRYIKASFPPVRLTVTGVFVLLVSTSVLLAGWFS